MNEAHSGPSKWQAQEKKAHLLLLVLSAPSTLWDYFRTCGQRRPPRMQNLQLSMAVL